MFRSPGSTLRTGGGPEDSMGGVQTLRGVTECLLPEGEGTTRHGEVEGGVERRRREVGPGEEGDRETIL